MPVMLATVARIMSCVLEGTFSAICGRARRAGDMFAWFQDASRVAARQAMHSVRAGHVSDVLHACS